jgi:hypothetical protein
MAIGYLTNIDLNNNQVKAFKIDNVTSDPTGLSGEGQMIYRTDTNQMKYHTGSNTWVAFGTSGGTVTSINLGSSTSTISVSGGPITTSGTIQVNLPTSGVTAGSYTSADITVNAYGIITAAADGGAGTMSSWKIGSTTGTDQDVTNGQVVDIVGGLYISGSVGGTRTVTLDHDPTSRSNSTSTGAPAAGATFTAIDSITSNSTGHITGVNTKTVTMPADNQGVTSISSGAGLTGGTITSVGSLAVDYVGSDNVILAAADGVTTPITVASTDKIIISDATDSNVKYVNISQLTAAVGGGTVTSVSASHAGNAFTAAIGGNANVNPSVDITMAGTSAQYVNGAGNLTTFPSIPQGDITAVTVTAPITGGGTSGSVAIGHASQTDTESTDAATLTFGGTFDAYTDVTTNATGHVTGHNVKTFTMPANPNVNTTSLPVKNSAGTTQFTSTQSTGVRFTGSGATSVAFTPASQLITISSTDNNETYTLPVSAGTAVSGHTVADFNLTAGGTGSGIKSRVTVAGKNDNISITETTGNNGVVKIALTDDVTIVSDLTVGDNVTLTSGNLNVSGTGSFTGQVSVPTATASTSAPTLAQVELLIAGVGIFQGGYNASTNSPALSGASNVALNLGDYFVVSVAGNNGGYFANLEPGDFIFANADIAAGSSPAASAYTVVQADANIAGSGTTDGNTQKGVSGFDSANFTVSANGWVQLNNQGTAGNYGDANETVTLAINADGIVTSASEQAIAITASQVTDFCTAVDTCVADNGVTANIGNGSATAYTITHNLNTRNVIVSCFRNSTPWDTVMLDVERTSVNLITLRTTTALASNAVSVIITKVT